MKKPKISECDNKFTKGMIFLALNFWAFSVSFRSV